MPNIIASLLGGSAGTSQSQNAGGSVNQSTQGSASQSASQSQTYGTEATQAAINAADVAYARQLELNRQAMEFNAMEAQKQRDWQERMANTIYTRSVKNMKEAGINPILAANMGLSGASVGSGATASISQASAPMSQTFANQSAKSVSESSSFGRSTGSSWQEGWSNSLYGIKAMTDQMSDVLSNAESTVQSAKTFGDISDALQKYTDKWSKNAKSQGGAVNKVINDLVNLMPTGMQNTIGKMLTTLKSNKGSDWQNKARTK